MIPGASQAAVRRRRRRRRRARRRRSCSTTSDRPRPARRVRPRVRVRAARRAARRPTRTCLAFPLQLALMTDGASRSRRSASSTSPTGSPSTGRSGRRAAVAARLGDAARAAPARARSSASHRGAGRRRARVGGVSTNLSRGGGGTSRRRARRPRRPRIRARPRPPWRLPGDLGRRYARGVGRPQPDPRAPAQREAVRLPDARSRTACGRRPAAWRRSGPGSPEAFTVEVRVPKPILLPATVEFVEGNLDGSIRFGVRDARRARPTWTGL